MFQIVSELNAGHEGQRLRLQFVDGEVAEVKLISVALPNSLDTTPESWGVIYDVLSSTSSLKSRTYWAQLDTIKAFEVIGDAAT
jgi:hypothetical protein